MQITLGPQHNLGEKPTVILYIYINRHAGTPEKHSKQTQRQCSIPSHMVVVIYITEAISTIATTWYLTGFPTGSNLGSTV